MENTPLVSIVVPVYNVEKYLDKCICSLLHQTYQNIEVILIDDGSVDSSLLIMRKYEKLDKRVVCVSKTNSGQAGARNAGLAMVKGTWVWNVDSDDYVELNSVEKMLTLALKEKSDIVITSYSWAEEDCKITHYVTPRFEGNITGVEALERMLRHEIGGDVVSKMYKHSLYTEYNIKIDEEYSVIDDVILNYRMFSVAKKVTAGTFHCLNHVSHDGSTSYYANTIDFRIKHHQGILAMANYGFVTDKVRDAYYGYIFSDLLTCISMRRKELLKKMELMKVNVLSAYLKYSLSYHLLKKERSSMKIELLSFLSKYALTRYACAIILRLYFTTFA